MLELFFNRWYQTIGPANFKTLKKFFYFQEMLLKLIENVSVLKSKKKLDINVSKKSF